MKVYRVYGSCGDWECSCERTMRTFANKKKAEKYLESQTRESIIAYCDFCNPIRKRAITIDMEEIEVE